MCSVVDDEAGPRLGLVCVLLMALVCVCVAAISAGENRKSPHARYATCVRGGEGLEMKIPLGPKEPHT